MRNQINRTQRNFVVEYKSNRRQPKEAAKSIWGDADLSALSNAVVDDMPPPIAYERQEMTTVSEKSPAVSEDQTIGMLPDPLYEREHAPTIQSEETTHAMTETATRSTKATRHKSKPLHSRRAEKPACARGKPQSKASLAKPSDVEQDELAVLENENRHLKGLLSDKLRSENKELTDMLRRFG